MGQQVDGLGLLNGRRKWQAVAVEMRAHESELFAADLGIDRHPSRRIVIGPRLALGIWQLTAKVPAWALESLRSAVARSARARITSGSVWRTSKPSARQLDIEANRLRNDFVGQPARGEGLEEKLDVVERDGRGRSRGTIWRRLRPD